MNEIFTISTGAAPAAEQAPGGMSMMIFLLVAFGVMIYFQFRSQKKQRKQREEMLSMIVKGTRVLLSNGIYGTISEVKGTDFVVEIADKVCVTVVRSGIAQVVTEEVKK